MGLKAFAGERFSEVSKVQDPPHDQQQLLARSATARGQFTQSLSSELL